MIASYTMFSSLQGIIFLLKYKLLANEILAFHTINKNRLSENNNRFFMDALGYMYKSSKEIKSRRHGTKTQRNVAF